MKSLNDAMARLGRAVNLPFFSSAEEDAMNAEMRDDPFALRLNRLHDSVPGQLPEKRLFRH